MKIRLFAIIILISRYTHSGMAQVPIANAGFETLDATSLAKAAQWGIEGQTNCILDSVNAYNGRYSIKLSRLEASGSSYFFQNQEFVDHGLKKYRVTCWMRAKNLKGKAGLGVRIFDKDGNSITGYRAITITKDQGWEMMEGEFYSDEAAVRIRYFGNVEGQGDAWFDDIKIDEVGLSSGSNTKKTIVYVNEYFDYVNNYSIVSDSISLPTDKNKNEKNKPLEPFVYDVMV